MANIAVAVLLALLVRSFILTGYRVPTTSMAPNLVPGDFIFSFRLTYGINWPRLKVQIPTGKPHRGDVAVFTYAEQPKVRYVKRIVGLEGDVVELRHGLLFVNGAAHTLTKLSDQQIHELTGGDQIMDYSLSVFRETSVDGSWFVLRNRESHENDSGQNFGPVVVPPGEVFLIGDNRDVSDDSRYWGTVPIGRLEGKVVLIWWSMDFDSTSSVGDFPSVRWKRVFTSL